MRPEEGFVKFTFIALGILALLIVVLWLGLRVPPRPFAAFPQSGPTPQTAPLPDGLPAPVERYFRQIYGDRVPVIKSAVITGRAAMSPVGGVTVPARFRFVHDVGKGYRHYFELTWFGLKLGVGNEHYLDGKSRLELPMGLSDEGPNVDQAANLSMWAEYVWLPAALLTTPGVRWQAVDDDTALLVVPFGASEQTFVTRFDPATGRLTTLESMRYKDSKSTTKTLWLNESKNWQIVSGVEIPTAGAVTWFDQGKPWAVFTVEDVVYNVDVQDSIRQMDK